MHCSGLGAITPILCIGVLTCATIPNILSTCEKNEEERCNGAFVCVVLAVYRMRKEMEAEKVQVGSCSPELPNLKKTKQKASNPSSGLISECVIGS